MAPGSSACGTQTPVVLPGRRHNGSPAQSDQCAVYSVKKGVRYRYYVSQAILGSRPKEAGRVGRVSATDLESLIERFLRERFPGSPGQSVGAQTLVETNLERALVLDDAIELTLKNSQDAAAETVSLVWRRKPLSAEKGTTTVSPLTRQDTLARNTLLAAIGNAHRWMDELLAGNSIAEIASREGKSLRHIRLLAPLAFVSPQTVSDLISGTARIGTVTELAPRVPLLWSEIAGSLEADA
jgi:site-specific DNA recombinase